MIVNKCLNISADNTVVTTYEDLVVG
jgi:hypothetical protein